MLRRLSTSLRSQKLDAKKTLNAILDQTLCPSSHAKILKLIDSNQNGIIEPKEIYKNLEGLNKMSENLVLQLLKITEIPFQLWIYHLRQNIVPTLRI
ncbi:unnamed protein product [Oikopleura dioica]|uniref:EF-hand domain-containing protein n=1 Tax=Oikopleura dioica TaxID=34765 RepID=E4XH28_OIKDI|nr:unnamed protein product [Oikopleura dioica]CBY39973.1 unnamed protein product [Oikopleura dioica]